MTGTHVGNFQRKLVRRNILATGQTRASDLTRALPAPRDVELAQPVAGRRRGR